MESDVLKLHNYLLTLELGTPAVSYHNLWTKPDYVHTVINFLTLQLTVCGQSNETNYKNISRQLNNYDN